MAMGVVKALEPKRSWGAVKRCDQYLRGELKEQIKQGTIKTDAALYDALNCYRDNFTKTCMLYMKQYGQKKVKAYEIVQSFSPEDRKEGLTPELAHKLGMEFARRFFPEYPVLMVTHIDTDHIHNQMLIGNVNVDDGKCLQINKKKLEEMKEYIGKKCLEHGLTNSVFQVSDRKAERVRSEEKSNAEHLMEKHGKVTDKAQVAHAARLVLKESSSIEEFTEKLKERYGIEVRTTKSTISFSHPEMKRAVRGNKLGEDLTKEAIENGFKLVQSGRNQEANEWYQQQQQERSSLLKHIKGIIQARKELFREYLESRDESRKYRGEAAAIRRGVAEWIKERDEIRDRLEREPVTERAPERERSYGGRVR